MTATPARNARTAALEALIEAHAIELKLPTVRRRFRALAARGHARAADPDRLPRRAAWRPRWPNAPSAASGGA